jgi:hypothetical protein
MKRIKAITFFVLAVLTTVSGATAQVGVVRAIIPFDFTVENRSLPAGTYEITQLLPMHNVVKIQNSLDPHITTDIVTLSGDTESHDKSVLIFKKYGNRYFLHEVFGPGVMNVNLFVSKEEKQIRQQTTELKLNDTHLIVIAAK